MKARAENLEAAWRCKQNQQVLRRAGKQLQTVL